MADYSETHGKMDADGCTRQCDEHGCHGPLYVCDAYDVHTTNEIAHQTGTYVAALSNSQWCGEQLANGLPPEALAILKALAGLE